MSKDRKPIEAFNFYSVIKGNYYCKEKPVRELESLLKSKEALLDKAVEVLEMIRISTNKNLMNPEYQLEEVYTMATKALTEIQEKRC